MPKEGLLEKKNPEHPYTRKALKEVLGKTEEIKEEENPIKKVEIQKGGKEQAKGHGKRMELTHNEEAFLLNLEARSKRLNEKSVSFQEFRKQLEGSIKMVPQYVPVFGLPGDSEILDEMEKLKKRGLVNISSGNVGVFYSLTKVAEKELEKIHHMEFLINEIRKHGEKMGHGDQGQD